MDADTSIATYVSTTSNHSIAVQFLRFVSGYNELGNANRSTLIPLVRSRACHKS